MSKINVKRVIIFKHGVSYYILEGILKGPGKFELEFKIDEMNDILKSLFVLDTSEKGYISSISYDAALETSQLLKSIMLNIPDRDSFSSLITQIKGADVNLTIGGAKKVSGKIMGIEFVEKLSKVEKITEKLLILLQEDGSIAKYNFSEIKSLEILNEEIKKDLKFFLDTVIAGKKKDAKKIIINCESGGDDATERNIFVSYIRESPIWKTSYRLIVSKQQELEQKCLLSGWSLIENTTNQDWEDIELSLVAGLPVSFIYDFYKPIFIQRPVIQPPKILSARPTEIEEGLEMDKFDDYAMAEMEAIPSKKRAKAMSKSARPSPAPVVGGFGRMQSVMSDTEIYDKVKSQVKTQTKDLGELFEYNISNPVTIKRKQSALVPILTESIKSNRILLYNKNDHDKNPNACLEITNNTNLTLETGPATIIYDDNLAGEAIIPFLNKGDTRLLNYAIEQAVIITHEQESENLSVHRVTFGSGYSYEYYYTNMTTTYKIKNKTEQEKELYLDHPKTYEYKVIEKPVEPEETTNYWRFKLTLKPKDAVVFKLKEQRENYSSNYIWNFNKEDLLKRVGFYVKQKFIDPDLETKLKEIAGLIQTVNDLRAKDDKLNEERDLMTDEQVRLRENISVLGEDSQSISLKERYIKKLNTQESRFEEIKKELKILEKKIKELNTDIENKMNLLSPP
ncbi:MAG: hypothetical protein KAV01_08360 [Candidatus Lokiarchaeota archaeon]|nr:hypothetical protein [Candidatus Lokiarchaeota archaeon]MCK4480526.1 hypothetical protein [Candidatus Lokiarchaeota archaeon]